MTDNARTETAKAAVAQAWDEGAACKHCDGNGTVPGGRRLIHCLLGFTGADWDVESVQEVIERADEVTWDEQVNEHQLVVQADGRTYRFGVKRPSGSAS